MKSAIRQAILRELRRSDINPNQLAELVAGRVHRSHVYDFLAGRKDLSTVKASHLIHALGLDVTPRKLR